MHPSDPLPLELNQTTRSHSNSHNREKLSIHNAHTKRKRDCRIKIRISSDIPLRSQSCRCQAPGHYSQFLNIPPPKYSFFNHSFSCNRISTLHNCLLYHVSLFFSFLCRLSKSLAPYCVEPKADPSGFMPYKIIQKFF